VRVFRGEIYEALAAANTAAAASEQVGHAGHVALEASK